MRLTWKLTAAMTAGTILILAADGALRLRREWELFHADSARDLRVMARTYARELEHAQRLEGEPGVRALLADAQLRGEHVRLRLVRAGAEAPDPEAPRPGLDPAALRAGRDVLVLHTPDEIVVAAPLHGSEDVAVEVTEALGDARAYLRATALNTGFTLLALTAVGCLVAAAAGARLVGRPTARLIDLARRIGAGDLRARVEGLPHDELEELGDALNTMAGRLEAARQQVELEASARAEAEAQLRHSDRLATAGRLAAGVAHELGTPLNVVAGRAKILATRELGPVEVRENARIMAEQAVRMTGTIRQLLDFTRRGPAPSGSHVAHDLRRVVERVVELLASTAGRTRVELRSRLPEDEVLAMVDPGQLEQVLTNLVMNAVQATPGGGQVELEVGRGAGVLAPRGAPRPCVFVRVRDHGQGILPEHLPHLFEPFFTTKDVGEGTGLGLSVAHGIVTDHGGRIEVTSAPGAGSTFTVWLPALETPALVAAGEEVAA